MEKSEGFDLMKPYYYTQLEVVEDYLNSKKTRNAIHLLTTLIEQLHEDMLIFDKMNTIDIKKMLKTCYVWREYYYFMWLIEDPDTFQKNRTLNIKTILQGYQEMISNKLFYALEENEYKINIRFNIVRLLFEEYINPDILQHMRQSFCAGFNIFQQMNQIKYQALALLGLVLVATHEGEPANAQQGLHFAKILCPALSKFIQMVLCEITNILNRAEERVNLLINPSLNSNHLASTLRP